jgi:flagellar biosynthetic protein FliQ
VPKIVRGGGGARVAGPWMLTTLVEYLQRTLQAIPTWSADAATVRRRPTPC